MHPTKFLRCMHQYVHIDSVSRNGVRFHVSKHRFSSISNNFLNTKILKNNLQRPFFKPCLNFRREHEKTTQKCHQNIQQTLALFKTNLSYEFWQHCYQNYCQHCRLQSLSTSKFCVQSTVKHHLIQENFIVSSSSGDDIISKFSIIDPCKYIV